MLNKIEYEQQKLIAKFINKISKINKTSICLTIIILYYYLSDDYLSIIIDYYLLNCDIHNYKINITFQNKIFI